MLKRRFRPQHELDQLEQVVEVAAGELMALRDAALGAARAIEAAAAEADHLDADPSAAPAESQPRSQRLARALVARSEVIAASCEGMLEQLDEIHPRITVRATGAQQAPSAGDAEQLPAVVATGARGETAGAGDAEAAFEPEAPGEPAAAREPAAAGEPDAAGDREAAEPPSEGVRLLVLQMRAAGSEPEAIEERLRAMGVPDPRRAVDEFLD